MSKNKTPLEGFPLYPLYQKMVEYDRSRALGHASLDINTYFVLHRAFSELVDTALQVRVEGEGRGWKNVRGALMSCYALQRGHQLFTKEELYNTCRLVLLKPHHSEERFKALFEDYLRELMDQHARELEEEPEKKKEGSEKKENEKTDSGENVTAEAAENASDGAGERLGERDEETQEGRYEERYESVAIKFEKLEGVGDTILFPSPKRSYEDAEGRHQFIWEGPHRPIEIRTVQQVFRSQREEQQRARRWQVDVEGTVNEICQTGFWHGLRFKPEVSYKTSVALLIDSGKSMVAFHAFANDLINIVSDSDMQEQANPHVYFFHNCPLRFVYKDKALTQAVGLAQFIEKADKPLLVFSDAGAARGGLSEQRIGQTRFFLEQLGDKHVAWINPIPRIRWYGTSAYEISKMVNMVDATQEEFINVVDILKGRIRPKYFDTQ